MENNNAGKPDCINGKEYHQIFLFFIFILRDDYILYCIVPVSFI